MKYTGVSITGRNAVVAIIAFTILASNSILIHADDEAGRFDRFFEHMVDVYYRPVGIEAEDVDDLFRETGGRFVAITMGYGLSRQAKLVEHDNARQQIFNGLIVKVETLLDRYAETEMKDNPDPAAVKKYKKELNDLFVASLAGLVDKQIEAFGVPPHTPSIFEEDEWELAYPQGMPPVEFMFARWGEMSAYDGKAVGMYRSRLHTSKTGQYGYLFDKKEINEELYGEKAIKYWRIEGDRMLWIRANGTVFSDMKFRVNKDRWEFYGSLLDEKGERVMNQSDRKLMDMIIWLKIPDRFVVQVPTGSSDGIPSSTGTSRPITATPTSNAVNIPAGSNQPASGSGNDAEHSDSEANDAEPSLRGDLVAVKVALKEIQKWSMSGNLYRFEQLTTGNAAKQIGYARQWRSDNPIKAKAYEKLLILASLSFGEPELNAAGDGATVTASLSVFGRKLPIKINALELQLVENEWKLANVQYTWLGEEEDEDN